MSTSVVKEIFIQELPDGVQFIQTNIDQAICSNVERETRIGILISSNPSGLQIPITTRDDATSNKTQCAACQKPSIHPTQQPIHL